MLFRKNKVFDDNISKSPGRLSKVYIFFSGYRFPFSASMLF